MISTLLYSSVHTLYNRRQCVCTSAFVYISNQIYQCLFLKATQQNYIFYFFNLTYSRYTSSLPSCPVVTKDLPISPRFTPYDFLSRCKFSTLTTRQPMVDFYLLTFPRFPLRKKEHKSYFGRNRTHDFRTSRCAGYLLDHSGGEEGYFLIAQHRSTIGEPV